MAHLRLFSATGIELEYMIVDRESLAVRPFADRLLRDGTGAIVSDLERGAIAWSNELVSHVIELKTNGPAPSLLGLPELFAEQVRQIDELLRPHGARLMPGGCHPWFDPATETVLWTHEYSEVYAAFDRIFDCRGHGWSNLQSMHINLPFADDAEFGALHAAIRVLLPILPALSASTPVMDGRLQPGDDTRLQTYKTNARRVPSVAGKVVPEAVFTRRAYEEKLLGRIYRDMAELDPEGVLRFEFVNARGAIARFDRHAIEIRVLDTQEHPRADLAIAAAISSVLAALVGHDGDVGGTGAAGRRAGFATLAEQQRWSAERLAETYERVVVGSDATRLVDADYRALFGVRGECTAGELWTELLDRVWPASSEGARTWRPTLDVILRHGSLARRLRQALGEAPSRARLHAVWAHLCDCLHDNEPFLD